ncbi:MAG TPA: alpha/beta hydrolase [Mycobacteriales bacterium]|nr:alpha/beta hydrolase [Mycobacteriales bacterium]
MIRSVDVSGGQLTFEVHSGSTEPVLAIHGVSSQRLLWSWLRRAAPEISLIVPDLRGRGDSVDVAGPSSIRQHAEDMVGVLDELGLDSAHVCGMSMGGWVAVALAALHPGRVRTLTLVDGGVPTPPPPGLTPENAVGVALADRKARLERTFATVEDYRDLFVSSTAPLLDPHDAVLLDYLRHDLRDGHVRLSAEALATDTADVFFGEQHWSQVAAPTRLLVAEWSVGAGTPPACSDALLAEHASGLDEVVRVPGVDHAAIIMSPAGAEAVAGVLRRSLSTAS